MALEYDFKKKPVNLRFDHEGVYYPSVVSKGTITTKMLIENITSSTSLTSADMKGALEALRAQVVNHLNNGYNVELEGLGYLSIKLKCAPVHDKKDLHSQSIQIDNVNFRPAASLKRSLRKDFSRARSGFRESKNRSEEERMNILKKYLDNNPFITCATYSEITGLLKGKALRELNRLVESNILSTEGIRSHKVFLWNQGSESLGM